LVCAAVFKFFHLMCQKKISFHSKKIETVNIFSPLLPTLLHFLVCLPTPTLLACCQMTRELFSICDGHRHWDKPCPVDQTCILPKVTCPELLDPWGRTGEGLFVNPWAGLPLEARHQLSSGEEQGKWLLVNPLLARPGSPPDPGKEYRHAQVIYPLWVSVLPCQMVMTVLLVKVRWMV
jgi:hypothetical protein